MKTIEEKIENMLNGEKKRRDVAIEWLEKLTESIKDVCIDIYGDADNTDKMYELNTNAFQIKVNGKSKKYYFRYSEHYGQNSTEYPGFYGYFGGYEMYWGNKVDELRGADFWASIRVIMNWLPEFEKLIDEKTQSRNMLVSKMLI